MNIDDIDKAYQLKHDYILIENFESEFADNPDLNISSIKLYNGTEYFIPSIVGVDFGKVLKEVLVARKDEILKEIDLL